MNITTEQLATLNAARTILRDLSGEGNLDSMWDGRVVERADNAWSAITAVLIGLKVYCDTPITDDELHNREPVSPVAS